MSARARGGDPGDPGDPGRAPVGPALVRVAPPDPEAVGEDAELLEALRAEIRAEGPVTFARFMERALYEPGHGYYRRPEPGPGASGDFVTAPELHPVAGASLGSLLEEAWRALGAPGRFVLTEPGAGTGALVAGLLGGLAAAGSPLLGALRYRPVEIEAARLVALRARLEADGLAAHLEEGPPVAGEIGAVIANEVADALPVHRVVARADGLRELLVGLDADGRLVPVEADPTTPRLAAALAELGVELAEGRATEVCLVLDDWLAGATAHLAAGIVVVADYADESAALRGPGRAGGTIRAFARHAVSGDPLRHVGRQDLTATVDLGALRAAAGRAGLVLLGETTQAELLAATGGTPAVAAVLRRSAGSVEGALALRAALSRLLDPSGIGGFAVVVLGRALPPGTRLAALGRIGGR